MLFNVLLLTCLSPHKSYSEKGVQVKVEQSTPDESILFFPIDSPNKQKDLGINGAICDLLIYYTSDNKKVICLVELKGGDIKRAVEQLKNTFQHFRQSLDQSIQPNSACRSEYRKLVWKACVRFSGAAPQDIKSHQATLDKIFGKGNWNIERYKSAASRDSNENLGPFIRK